MRRNFEIVPFELIFNGRLEPMSPVTAKLDILDNIQIHHTLVSRHCNHPQLLFGCFVIDTNRTVAACNPCPNQQPSHELNHRQGKGLTQPTHSGRVILYLLWTPVAAVAPPIALAIVFVRPEVDHYRSDDEGCAEGNAEFHAIRGFVGERHAATVTFPGVSLLLILNVEVVLFEAVWVQNRV